MTLLTKTLVVVLSLVAQSAFYTDSLQTQHWIAGTPEDPILLPRPEKEAVYHLFEDNPILAGRPEMLQPCLDFWNNIIELTPQHFESPWVILILGFLAGHEVKTVVRNNEYLKEIDFPQYYGISYRWRF